MLLLIHIVDWSNMRLNCYSKTKDSSNFFIILQMGKDMNWKPFEKINLWLFKVLIKEELLYWTDMHTRQRYKDNFLLLPFKRYLNTILNPHSKHQFMTFRGATDRR